MGAEQHARLRKSTIVNSTPQATPETSVVISARKIQRQHAQAGPRVVVDFDELRRLVGREKPTAVKKWLQSKGILYWLNAKNQPVTTSTALNDALMRGRKTEPNWNPGQ